MASMLSLGLLMGVASSAMAQTPLTDQIFPYNQIPYQVDTNPTGRGPQFGFNQCNSTTQNQNSNCQTALLNSIDDFCLWGPPNPNSAIGDEEAETVAFCTKPTHGARVIPEGALTGVQVLKAPAYTLFAVNLRQELVNVQTGDGGGELDPHGADQRGNPLGGLVYTTNFNGGSTPSQVIEWHNFIGSDISCFKICNPNVPNSKVYCNNIFDRTGCNFVAPAAYQDGVFEVCASDNQDPVGVYTGADGKTSTYSQPPEGVDITSLPSIKTPASSQCTTYTSGSIYAAMASVTPTFSVTQDTVSIAGASTPTSSATSASSSSTSSGVTTKASTSSTASGSSSHSATATTSSQSGAAAPAFGAVPVGPIVAIAGTVLAAFGAVIVGM